MSSSNTVILPREVLDQVLTALVHAEKDSADFQQINTDQTGEAIEALRAALKHPDAGPPATAPEGWKLVPVEPTREMIEAGKDAHYEAEKRIQEPDAWSPGGFAKRAVRATHVFQAMLAAAPQPPALDQPQFDQAPYLYYDPHNGDTWTQEAIDDGCCPPDGLIALYTK